MCREAQRAWQRPRMVRGSQSARAATAHWPVTVSRKQCEGSWCEVRIRVS